MALSASSVWGKAVADAIKALNISDNAAITDSQLELFWTTVVNEHRLEITNNLEATGTTDVTIGSSLGVYTSTIPVGGHS